MKIKATQEFSVGENIWISEIDRQHWHGLTYTGGSHWEGSLTATSEEPAVAEAGTGALSLGSLKLLKRSKVSRTPHNMILID